MKSDYVVFLQRVAANGQRGPMIVMLSRARSLDEAAAKAWRRFAAGGKNAEREFDMWAHPVAAVPDDFAAAVRARVVALERQKDADAYDVAEARACLDAISDARAGDLTPPQETADDESGPGTRRYLAITDDPRPGEVSFLLMTIRARSLAGAKFKLAARAWELSGECLDSLDRDEHRSGGEIVCLDAPSEWLARRFIASAVAIASWYERFEGPEWPQRIAGMQEARCRVEEACRARGIDLDGKPARASVGLDEGALAEALARLEALVGLAGVKTQIHELVDLLRLQQRRATEGLKPVRGAQHVVFLGNPGTGKTEVARLLADIYHALGMIRSRKVVEVSRADLVGEYIGKTAQMTSQVIDRALGGVLFVDEAYALYHESDRDFGHEAIAELMRRMENDRDSFVVVLAGYPAEMRALLGSNPGLASRIGMQIEFADYTPDELVEIFRRFVEASDYRLADGAVAGVRAAVQRLEWTGGRDFGGARAVRNLVRQAIQRHAARVMREDEPGRLELQELTAIDIPMLGARAVTGMSSVDDVELDAALGDLDALVGLAPVKEQVRELVALLRVQRAREDAGLEAVVQAPSLLFVGGPGTGKTTVARIIARIYGALGLCRSNRLVEATYPDLVGTWPGETARKVERVVDRSLDGVLFIDEAYALARDYGQEAVTTLLHRMERDRSRLTVIFAGYEDEMRTFVASNPGLASRIPKTIAFPDYGVDELVQIFHGFATSAGYALDAGAERMLYDVATSVASTDDDFGNARGVRNLFEATLQRHAVRVDSGSVLDADTLSTLTADDIDRPPVKSRQPIGFAPVT